MHAASRCCVTHCTWCVTICGFAGDGPWVCVTTVIRCVCDVAGWDALTAPERWEPDDQMVAAVLATHKTSRRMTELSDADRAWLVAGLMLAGVTAQDIADRTGCSLRLVRAIRAEDITQMAWIAQTETGRLEGELRAERSGHALTRRELSEARAEVDRWRLQLDQIVGAAQAGALKTFRKCGHPMVRYNTYEHGGLRFCRECNRVRKAERRSQQRSPMELGQSSLHALPLASGT